MLSFWDENTLDVRGTRRSSARGSMISYFKVTNFDKKKEKKNSIILIDQYRAKYLANPLHVAER